MTQIKTPEAQTQTPETQKEKPQTQAEAKENLKKDIWEKLQNIFLPKWEKIDLNNIWKIFDNLGEKIWKAFIALWPLIWIPDSISKLFDFWKEDKENENIKTEEEIEKVMKEWLEKIKTTDDLFKLSWDEIFKLRKDLDSNWVKNENWLNALSKLIKKIWLKYKKEEVVKKTSDIEAKYNLPKNLFTKISWIESSYWKDLISNTWALWPFQLTSWIYKNEKYEWNPFDLDQAWESAWKFLNHLYNNIHKNKNEPERTKLTVKDYFQWEWNNHPEANNYYAKWEKKNDFEAV